MFETALVALDLSPAERPIIDCLPEMRRWGIEKVILTHVIQVGYAQGAGYGHEEDYKAWLEECAAPIRAEGLEVAISVRASGVPADEILAVADEVNASLLVIGSRGQSMVRTLFLGSVAREVIRRTTRPLLLEWVEPTADATQAHCEAMCRDTLGHVLLATDLSKHAGAAEAAAVALAGKAAQTDCLTVLTPSELDATPALPIMAKAALGAIMDRITTAGGRGDILVSDGEATETIAGIAMDRQCTLMIVGKQGQNWVEGMMIGSTAARLCETARRPVLMVPLG